MCSPIERGLYILKLNKINFEIESSRQNQNEHEKQQILMDIYRLNEELDETRDSNQLKELEKELDLVMMPFEKQLEEAFDQNNIELAINILAKMKYYKNIEERVNELKLKFQLDVNK